ncbi:MAG: carbon-phosphorus lyase complex subunit PhnI [Reinekea sp.]|nr:carbon-phosphorus lyase complex subunit PhnI [Reinekea sp.]
MYVAVKGGEKAIAHAHDLLSDYCRGDVSVPEIDVVQLAEQMPFAISRVMAEGSLYEPTLAALALKQAGGDVVEAIFLIRAFRTTLPRYGYSTPVNEIPWRVQRRISAIYKDLPGGQLLGPTFDYTHRLLNFDLFEQAKIADRSTGVSDECQTLTDKNAPPEPFVRVGDILRQEGLLSHTSNQCDSIPHDLSLDPLEFPAERSTRLQALARGDEGFLMSLAYSTQRGYARNHPFAGEITMGWVELEFFVDELDCAVVIGEIQLTECDMINQFVGSKTLPPQFTQGYGLVFGYSERKAMAMALMDRAMRADEFDEPVASPAQQQEFVLAHCDALDASGFVSHLKLPHYVDFQAELELVRTLRRQYFSTAETAENANA